VWLACRPFCRLSLPPCAPSALSLLLPAAATAANQSRQEIVLHGPPERVREAYHLLLGNIRKYGPTNLPPGAVPNPLPFGRPGGRG
jgi:hypothetical protein